MIGGARREAEKENNKNLMEDAAAMGMSIELATEYPESENLFEVYPENMPAVIAFCAGMTQWRTGGMGGVIGLDYTAVDVAINRLELPMTPDDFRGMQTMERRAVKVMNDPDARVN